MSAGLKILWLQPTQSCEVMDQTRVTSKHGNVKSTHWDLTSKKSGLNNQGTVNRLIHCGLINWCWTSKMMSDPASFQKSKKGVSLKWSAMRNDFLDRRSENLPRLSGYIWPTKSLDDKAEWVIPQINTWCTAMADLRMNPPGNGVKLVETTNQTLFVTFVSTLSPAQLLYQHFRLMRWCWTPQNWKIVLLNPHVDLLNAFFSRQKPISSILLVLESPWFDQGPSELSL